MADQLSVIVLTSRSRVGECGVADYASALARSLSSDGLEVAQLGLDRLRDMPQVVGSVGERTIVHLQYPLLAWRTSPIPLLLLLWLRLQGHRQIVVTIHEFSRAHWARRIACVLLARLGLLTVSTSAFEASSLRRWMPVNKPVEVIPIASNIQPLAPPSDSASRSGLVYFGLLAPDKGLETFLDIVAPWLGSAVAVTVVGNVVPGQEGWLQAVRNRHPQAQFRLSLSVQEVSEVLHGGLMAVLPYPDGISERRGSALAALAHGLEVVSTRGAATTSDLADVCHLVNGNDEARAQVTLLLDDPSARKEASVVRRYVALRSWDAIASLHAGLYRKHLADQGGSRWK